MIDLSTIQARAEELRAQQQKINEELSEIEAALRVINRYALVQSSIPTAKPMARASSGGRLNKRDTIIQAVQTLLALQGNLHTAEIYETLHNQGVEISETRAKSIAQLSSYMSPQKTLFVADRRRGWSLNKKPDNAQTLPGIPHG